MELILQGNLKRREMRCRRNRAQGIDIDLAVFIGYVLSTTKKRGRKRPGKQQRQMKDGGTSNMK